MHINLKDNSGIFKAKLSPITSSGREMKLTWKAVQISPPYAEIALFAPSLKLAVQASC